MKISTKSSDHNYLIQVQTSISCSQSDKNHISSSLFVVNLGEAIQLPYICPYCHENILLTVETTQKRVVSKQKYSKESEERKTYLIGLLALISSVFFVFVMDLLISFIHSQFQIALPSAEFFIMLSGITIFPFIVFFILHYFFINSAIPSADNYYNLFISSNSSLHHVSYQKTSKST